MHSVELAQSGTDSSAQDLLSAVAVDGIGAAETVEARSASADSRSVTSQDFNLQKASLSSIPEVSTPLFSSGFQCWCMHSRALLRV
jgi:hypothetical protein